jgi:hypothetical protein
MSGSGRSLPVVGNARSRELCDARVLARCTLQVAHFRLFTSNHRRPVAATTNTTTTDHVVDEFGCSLTATDFTIAFF